MIHAVIIKALCEMKELIIRNAWHSITIQNSREETPAVPKHSGKNLFTAYLLPVHLLPPTSFLKVCLKITESTFKEEVTLHSMSEVSPGSKHNGRLLQLH